MRSLREDLRAHPVASALVLALWVAITLCVGAVGMTTFGFFVLLVPVFAAGWAIGRSRRRREARSSGIIASLVTSAALADLSLVALSLAGRIGEPEPFISWQVTLFELAFWGGLVDLFALVAGGCGWLMGHADAGPDAASEPVA